MRRNDSETEEKQEVEVVPPLPGYNPGALSLLGLEVVRRLTARLTGSLKAYYEKNEERILRMLNKLLKQKRAELIKSRAAKRTTGMVVFKDQENVYTFPSVEAAKNAVVGMVADLAILPPPLPAFKDEAGFSSVTDGPLRSFLAKVSAGYADDQDYLFASRLLIEHCKTQLPRAVVLGAVRTLEQYLNPKRVTPPLANKPAEEDKRIYERLDLNRGGRVPLSGGSKLRWTYDPSTGYLSLYTKAIKPTDIRDSINGAGGRAKLEYVQQGEYRIYHTDLPVQDVPLLIALLNERGYTRAAEQLQVAWDNGWQEKAERAPAPKAVPGRRSTSTVDSRLPRPAEGRVEGTLTAGAYYAPKFYKPTFVWEVTPEGVQVGFTSNDRVNREVVAGTTVPLWSLAYVLNLGTPENFKLLLPVRPTVAADLMQGWFEGVQAPSPLQELPYLFDYMPALKAAWQENGLDAVVISEKPVKSQRTARKTTPVTPTQTGQSLGAEPPKATVDLNMIKPKLHADWADLQAQPDQNLVRDLAFAYEWSRFIPKSDESIEDQQMIHVGGGRMVEIDPSKIPSLGFNGKTEMPSSVRHIELIATIARHMASPSYLTCPGVFVVPQRRMYENMTSDLREAWTRANSEAYAELDSPDFQAKAILISTEFKSEICGWFLYFKEMKNKDGVVQIKDGLPVKYPYVMFFSNKQGAQNLREHPAFSSFDLKEGPKDSKQFFDSYGDKGVYTYVLPANQVSRLGRALDTVGEFVLSYTLRIAFLSEYMLSCPKIFPITRAENAPEGKQGGAAYFSQIPEPQRSEMQNMYDWKSITVVNEAAPGGPQKMGLMEYQEIGSAFVWLRGGRALIGDTMGLGKTVQAIAAVRAKPQRALPAVVVCPTSVQYNWGAEIERWYPGASVFVAGPDELAESPTKEELRADFIVIGWSATKKHGDRYFKRMKTLIVDESHYGKAKESTRATGARALARHADNTIVMSGTALDNAKIRELWSQLAMVDPNVFALADAEGEEKGYAKFVANFEPRRRNQSYKGFVATSDSVDNLRLRLKLVLRCYMLRRVKNQVDLGLGKKERYYAELSLTPEQRAVYDRALAKVYEAVLNSIIKRRLNAALTFIKKGETVAAATERANDLSYDPSKIANTSFVIYLHARKAAAMVKVPFALERILERLRDYPKDPVVVFVEFKDNIKYLEKALTERGIPYRVIQGGVDAKERKDIVKEFQQDKNNTKVKVFIGTKAAREGITLTRANYTLFVDRWYVPAWEEQAEDRTYRYTQTRDVMIEYLVAKGTIDETINKMILAKRSVIGDVFDDDKFLETEGMDDTQIEEEYAKEYMEQIEKEFEGLKDLKEEDTYLSEEQVREAARDSNDPYFVDIELRIDPNFAPSQRARVKLEIWEYIRNRGGKIELSALLDAGFDDKKVTISSMINEGYLKRIEKHRVLKNGLHRNRGEDTDVLDMQYFQNLGVDLPRFKIQPGQIKLRQIVDRKVTENPRRVRSLISKRHR